MKKVNALIALVAASMLLSAVPALSDEVSGTQMGPAEQTQQKDECLLLAKNCPDSVDTIQQRIDKLQYEIGRGADVYTSEEVQILQQKLDDANSVLRDTIEGG
jgi:hypothetical protein